jgi:hypothetical protein
MRSRLVFQNLGMGGPHSRNCPKCPTDREEKDDSPHGYSFISRMHKLLLLYSTHSKVKRFPDSIATG